MKAEACAAILVISSSAVVLACFVYRSVLPALPWLACTVALLVITHRRSE